MNLQNLLINSGIALTLSGCAGMLPYHENFSCNKGIGEGTCSSVTENYEYAIKQGRKSSGQSHVSGVSSNAMYHHDDAYDKVVVIDDAIGEVKR